MISARHVAAVLLVSGTTVLATAPPALAGETRTWDDSRYTAKGYAKASVTVDFPAGRAFDVQGWVQDVCPQDGYGAYLHTSYHIRNTNGTFLRTWTTFKDADGCGNGVKPFDPGPVAEPSGTKITDVTFKLCYEDHDGDGTGAVVANACISQTFDNWRVG